MSIEWEQYRDRYLGERPETFDAYVSVWTTDDDLRRDFTSWATFTQCANAEPAKVRDVPHLVERAEAAMRRHGYEVGRPTPRNARRWMKKSGPSGGGREATPASNRHDTGSDVRRALDAFGQHDGLESNKRSAMDVIERLTGSRQTAVSSVYWQEGDGSHVGVRLADEPDVVAARVHFGYVWHRDHLPGADPSSRPGTWYTALPENRIRGANTIRNPLRQVECPNDPGMMVPITGECICGWRPADEE